MKNSSRTLTVLLQPRDPLIARDARPFDPTPGARATTLNWPWPQTIAGALRTHIGRAIGLDWGCHEDLIRIHRTAIQGPLLATRRRSDASTGGWQVYFPAPADAVVVCRTPNAPIGEREYEVTRLVPEELAEGEGTDLPWPDDLQVLSVSSSAKPDHSLAFWSAADMQRWLLGEQPARPPDDWLGPLPQESRMHVAVSAATGTAREGALFTTTGLRFPDSSSVGAYPECAMLARIDGTPDGWEFRPDLIPLGGERRLSALEPAPDELWPTAPPPPSGPIERLRLVLVTPGIFERGWLPGWLDKSLTGEPPSAPGLRLKLVSAAVGRRLAISGWRMRSGRDGQRPTRYAAPPGSVYFFEILNGPLTASQWESLWLAPIADHGADRDNSYGLALPGRW